jgi:hypothetical protein
MAGTTGTTDHQTGAAVMTEPGQHVKAAGETGRVYCIDHDWAGLILDSQAHKTNPPIFWARISELEPAEEQQP